MPKDVNTYKSFIEPWRKRILESPKSSGLKFSKEFSYEVDSLIRHFTGVDVISNLAVYAIGSYGRLELCLHSDIDLLFVYDTRKFSVDDKIEKILYKLWDFQVPISQKICSLKELRATVKDDHHFATTLLEYRPIIIDETIHKSFARSCSEIRQSIRASFFEQKITELKSRHLNLKGPERYLEPNIKEGKGGLRDLNTMYWLAANLNFSKSFKELYLKGFLSEREYKEILKGLNFFLSLRNTIHALAKRKQEIFYFSWQEQISELWGLLSTPGTSSLEKLMATYYNHVELIDDFIGLFISRFHPRPKMILSSKNHRDYLTSWLWRENDTLHCKINLLREQPKLLYDAFIIAQKEKLRLSKKIISLAKEFAALPISQEEEKVAYNKIFRLISNLGTDQSILFLLHKCGLLGKFIPDFKRLRNHWQVDFYHIYTVDNHSLRCVDYFRRLYRGELLEKYPYVSNLAFNLLQPEFINLALLFHDIGKGLKEDHSIKGVEIFADFAEKIDLDKKSSNFVSDLIRYHLFLSSTATKRDPDDPETIKFFCETVRNKDFLDALMVLTHCDIINVGPDRYSPWKEKLMIDLHKAATSYLTANKLPAVHKVSYEPLYPKSFKLARQGRSSFIFNSLSIKTTGVLLYIGPDYGGLLSLLAGSLAYMGVTILKAEIFPHGEDIVANKFTIDISDFRGDFTSRINQVWHQIHKQGSGNSHAKIQEKLKSMAAYSAPRPDIAPRVKFSKEKAGSILVEIEARDRPGLLYDLSYFCFSQGYYIIQARINTWGDKAIDSFSLRHDGNWTEEKQSLFGQEIYTRLRAETFPQQVN